MSGFKKLLARLGVAIQILVLSTGLGLTGLVSHASADSTVPITGTVTDPHGDGLGQVEVYLTLPGQTDALYATSVNYIQSVVIQQQGSYSLDVAPGTYDVHFVPYASGNWSNSLVLPNMSISGPTTLNEQLTPDNPTYALNGTAKTAQGAPLANNYIVLRPTSGGLTVGAQTDAAGHYSAAVMADTYNVSVLNNAVTSGLPQSYFLGESVVVNGATGFDITLPATFTATVLVKDFQGNPVANAPVTFNANYSLYNIPTPFSIGQIANARTNAQGIATVYLLGAAPVANSSFTMQACASYYADSIQSCVSGLANSARDPITGNASGEVDETSNYATDEQGRYGQQYTTSPASDLTMTVSNGHPVLHWTSQAAQNPLIDDYTVIRDGAQQLGGVYVGDFPTGSLSFIDITALPGVHTYSLVATEDGDPTETLPSLPVSVTVPSPIVAPVVNMISPAASAVLSGTAAINGSVSVNPNASSYNYMLYVFNSSSQAVVAKYYYAVPSSQTTQSYSWNTATVPNGNYTIVISAKDNLGNKDAGSTQTIHITVAN